MHADLVESGLFVGVDTGGSKTRVLVAGATGEVLAQVTGAGGAMRPGDAESCAAIVATTVRTALETAGCGESLARVLCVGASGVGREAERMALYQALSVHALAQELIVETDAAIALAEAFGDRAGILLIAGTGSIAVGRGPAGVLGRAGGWGPVMGDEGSGSWITRRALSAVAAAADGREPDTGLTGAILTAAQVNAPEELIPWTAAADREALASLAPSVLAAAAQGDGRASAIVDVAAEELVLHVVALARRLFVDERAAFEVACTGGLMGRSSLLRKRVERRLKGAVPGATVRAGEVDPAHGALRLARSAIREGR